MRNTCLVLATLLALVLPTSALADAQIYRMLTSWPGFKEEPRPGEPVNDTLYLAPKDSHFIILERGASYLVRFTRVAAINAQRSPGDAGKPRVRAKDLNYSISKDYLSDHNYGLFSGLDYGILTLPYKLQLKNKDITAGATLSGFVGYRQLWLFAPSTILVSAGFAGIPTTDPNATNVETKLGLTLAGGIVFPITNQFQIGIITGMDHLGGESGKQYPFNDRQWLSISIGTAFTK